LEKPPRAREYPIGLPDELWEGGVRRLKRRYRAGIPTFRVSLSSLEDEGPSERPEFEVRTEFLDLLASRFPPSCAKCLEMHVLDGIPLEKAAFRAGIGRRTALRELERLREMYR